MPSICFSSERGRVCALANPGKSVVAGLAEGLHCSRATQESRAHQVSGSLFTTSIPWCSGLEKRRTVDFALKCKTSCKQGPRNIMEYLGILPLLVRYLTFTYSTWRRQWHLFFFVLGGGRFPDCPPINEEFFFAGSEFPPLQLVLEDMNRKATIFQLIPA